MMQGIFLNVDELDALEGLPWPVVALYVLALRPLMDAATREVGTRSRVSWGRLALAINPDTHTGYLAPRVSRSAARRMGACLERAGLVRMRSSEVHKQLVFLLPLAGGFSLAQNKADTKPTHKADTPRTEGKHGQSRHRENGQADTYQRSKNKTPPPPTPPRKSGTQAPKKDREGEGVLFFPEKLTRSAQAALLKHLEGVDTPQIILDELGARMAQGGLRYPAQYAMRLIEKAQAGEFVPERADEYRQLRESRARAEAAIQERDQESARTVNTAAARAAVAELRAKVRHGKRAT